MTNRTLHEVLTSVYRSGWKEQDLLTILSQQMPESLHLEYKAGHWLLNPGGTKKRKGLADEIRKYVAAFANAEGGALIIGVHEPGRTPSAEAKGDSVEITSGVHADGLPPFGRVGEDWADWIQQQYGQDGFAQYLEPQPQVGQFTMNDRRIFCLAVPRSHHPVWLALKGKRREFFYRRVGSATSCVQDGGSQWLDKAPAYITEDIVFGRKRRPRLQVDALIQLASSIQTHDHRTPVSSGMTRIMPIRYRRLKVSFEVSNISLVWCDDVALMAVAFSLQTRPGAEVELNPAFTDHVEFPQPPLAHGVAQISKVFGGIPPIGVASGGVLSIRVVADVEAYQVAVAVIPKGHPPSWMQFTVPPEFVQQALTTKAAPTEVRVSLTHTPYPRVSADVPPPT